LSDFDVFWRVDAHKHRAVPDVQYFDFNVVVDAQAFIESSGDD